MRVLLLTTDLSARAEGRAARLVARALAATGSDVTVLAPAEHGAPMPRGIEVIRVADLPPMISLDQPLEWTLQFNAALGVAGARLAPSPDVVHAVGWKVAWAATMLARAHGARLAWTPCGEPIAGHETVADDAVAWLAESAGARVVVDKTGRLAEMRPWLRRMGTRALGSYASARAFAAPHRPDVAPVASSERPA